MASSSRVVLFSGGGTAGHLAPGFALAAALEERGLHCLFATPGESVERSWFATRPPPLRVHARRLPRTLAGKLTFPFHLARGVWQARRLLRRESVDCLVALGGWPCAPATVAARWTKTPIVFLVADAVPGLVVRKLGRWAGRLYLASEAARPSLEPHAGLRVPGPLLRDLVRGGRRAPEGFGLEEGRRTLLVTGGSLGARGLNERFLAGFEQALTEQPALRDSVQVLHSAGADASAAAALYRRLGVVHHVAPYIEDMGRAYATADLALARAGASTCAELEATTLPTVFVPYPHHADRQQFLNAQPLVERGAARLIEETDLSPETVRAAVLGLLADGEALAGMRAAFSPDVPDARAAAADDLIRFLEVGEPAEKQA